MVSDETALDRGALERAVWGRVALTEEEEEEEEEAI